MLQSRVRLRFWARVAALALLCVGSAHAQQVDSLRFGRFGKVALYAQSDHPKHVVLFVSGDGGWNLGVVDMAQVLTSLDALVVGIDITHYLRALQHATEPCVYPAGDFEALSQFVQKKQGFSHYVTPVLVGYSSGATLVYALLVQAPAHTFAGAISMGFCPDLPLRKPLCRGTNLKWVDQADGKGIVFQPATHLEVPWIAFQGDIDQVCNPKAVAAYVKQVPHAELVALPKVGHGFSVQRHWMPQFKASFERLVAQVPAPPPVPETLKDLPVIEVPATGVNDLMAVVLSGDGGWMTAERGLGAGLAKQGIPTAGLNDLQYFWTRRTPEVFASDMARLIQHYLAEWQKSQVILIGNSLGADVLPFAVTRLPDDLKARIRLVALLGPSRSVDFEFHLTDWLENTVRKTDLPVLPEIDAIRNTRVFCFYGTEDKEAICTALDSSRTEIVPFSSGHSFRNTYEQVLDVLGKELNR